MTVEKERKILQKIQTIQTEISALEDARARLATQEYVTVSMSSGSGSKSFSRQDITKIQYALNQLRKELVSLRKMLYGNATIGTTIIKIW